MNYSASECMQAQSPVMLTQYIDTHPAFTLRLDVRRLALCLAFAAIGGALIYLGNALSSLSEQEQFALSATGVVVVSISLLAAVLKLRYRAYAATGARLQQHDVYYDLNQLDRIRRAVDSADFSLLPVPKMEGQLRLEAFTAVDDAVVCLQISEYVDYHYYPLTAPVLYTDVKAHPLVDFFERY